MRKTNQTFEHCNLSECFFFFNFHLEKKNRKILLNKLSDYLVIESDTKLSATRVNYVYKTPSK